MSEFNDFYFSARLSEDKGREIVWKEIARYLRKYTSGTLVDIGCGRGDFLKFVKADKKIGVDVFKSRDFPSSLKFVSSDARNFSSKIKSADVVFASNLLEHFSDDDADKILDSVKKTLKKDGLFILMQPNFRYFYKGYFDDYTHKKIYTDVSLCDYLRSRDFEIVKCYPKFLPATMKSKLPKWSLLVWLYLRSPIKPFAGQMLVIARKK